MRSIFISDDKALAARLKTSLAEFVPNFARDKSAGTDEWTIVGDRYYARDKLSEYAETLGMTHLIASGRLPGIGSDALIRSHQVLLETIA